MAKPLVFLDVETGGLDCFTRPVLQCGIVIPIKDVSLNVKMNPGGMKVDERALEIQGVKREDLYKGDRVSQEEGALKVADFIKEHVGGRANVVCHNEKFDNGFMAEWFDRVGLEFKDSFQYQWECTLKLYLTLRNRNLIRPQSLQLGALCSYFGIPLENAHDALADVEATVKLYRHYYNYLSSGNQELLQQGSYIEE